MNTLLNIVLSNALIAACLLAALMMLRRKIKTPVMLHALLLLIIVKLITPAYWHPTWNLLPTASSESPAILEQDIPNASQSITTAVQQTTQNDHQTNQNNAILKLEDKDKSPSVSVPTDNTISEAEQPTVRLETGKEESYRALIIRLITGSVFQKFSLGHFLMVVWATGTVSWFLLAVWRISRFQLFLRQAQPASESLNQTAKSLANKIELKHVPEILMVSEKVSPMLWAIFSRSRIILPIGLLKQLNNDERDTLLLHELAHYKRGDHWVRLVEFLATGIYWWYPVLWLIRREIRTAEEQCCDAWVVQTLPEKRRSYAEVLVKAIAYVSRPTLVAGATGMGSHRVLERRLECIMRESLTNKASRSAKFCIVVAAVVLLPFAPMLGQGQSSKQPVSPQQAQTVPTIKEILSGYHANINKLMPLEMHYNVTTSEYPACMDYDRRQLKGFKRVLKMNYTDFASKAVGLPADYNEEHFQMLLRQLMESTKRLTGNLKPEQIKIRLAERVIDRGYFWSDGESLHRRWTNRSGDRDKNELFDLGPVTPAQNLNTLYSSVNLASWSANNNPPYRHWSGRSPEAENGYGEVASTVSLLPPSGTLFGPLGKANFVWEKLENQYSIDQFTTKDPSLYEVIGQTELNGRSTILVDLFLKPFNKTTGLRWRIRAWVDPAQGYLPLRLEWAYIDKAGKSPSGLNHHIEVMDVKKIAGGYYPVRIKFQQYIWDALGTDRQVQEIGIDNLPKHLPPLPSLPSKTEVWEVTNLATGKTIDPATLALEFPKGTRYSNKVDGKSYYAGNPAPIGSVKPPLLCIPVGEIAPPLHVARWTDGKSRNLADFRGQVVAVLFLDISGFAENLDEIQLYIATVMKQMKAIHTKYALQDVVFLEIYPPGTTQKAIRVYQKLRGGQWLAGIDQGTKTDGGVTEKEYNGNIVGAGPFLIGRNGRIACNPDLFEGDYGMDLYINAARKLSVSFDESDEKGMQIIEYIINEQIDKALAAKNE